MSFFLRQRISLLLAKKFILSKHSDGFLSLITWVSVGGVALGVAALTTVTSVINGFEDELVRVITDMNGDVILYSRGVPVAHPEKTELQIQKIVPETQAITHSFVTELMVAGDGGVAGAVLEGVDFATFADVTAVHERVIEGRMPVGEKEIALGQHLAQKLGAELGKSVRLVFPDIKTDAGRPHSEVIDFKVVGFVKMGLYQYDSKFIYTGLAEAQKLLKQPGRVTAFKIKLPRNVDSFEVSERLSDQFGYPYRAKNWGQLNQNLLYAVKLEKVVIAIILTVIVFVAAFNVVSTLMMMIHDKGREMAILRAMGLRKHQTFWLFCLIGGGIGCVGTVAGVSLGLVLNRLAARLRILHLPEEIYYLGSFPVVERWNEILVIAFGTFLICMVATFFPAVQVARRAVLEGIRND